ncbi:MAG: cysteine desulfurase [Planctomycetota bacterium]
MAEPLDLDALKRGLSAPGSARVYFDHNASTPLRPEVRAAMDPWLGARFGNAESLHREGQAARAAVESARRTCAEVLGCDPEAIAFTGGGTEALNLALRGIAWARRLAGQGMRLVASAVEHAAVDETLLSLDEEGFDRLLVSPEADGRVDPERYAAALDDWTAVAALIYAHNETGVIQPVREAAAACAELRIPFVLDAVQAAGKLNLKVEELGCAALALSGHKFGGPQGAGLLYLRPGTPFRSALTGGGQEAGRRGGTHAVAQIVGFAEALRLAEADRTAETPRLNALRERLEAGLLRIAPDFVLHGAGAERLSQTVFASFPGLESAALVNGLDLEGVAVSSGAACSEGTHVANRTLQAMGVSEALAKSAVRFSLGRTSSAADVERALEGMVRVVKRLKRKE